MLIKVQQTIFEVDDVTIIHPIQKYNGEMYFRIELNNKQDIKIGWLISKVLDSEDILYMKTELLRTEIAKLKNKSDTISELGQTISLKKEKEIKVPGSHLRAAKKATK